MDWLPSLSPVDLRLPPPFQHLLLLSPFSILSTSTPRPGLQPLPGTVPLTLTGALVPPILYFFALLLLPPFPDDGLSRGSSGTSSATPRTVSKEARQTNKKTQSTTNTSTSTSTSTSKQRRPAMSTRAMTRRDNTRDTRSTDTNTNTNTNIDTNTKTSTPRLVAVTRNCLALAAAYTFYRLPLTYYVPFSIGLTYQLALVGLYGGCRVVDAFFVSYYLLGHIPRRVSYRYESRLETPRPTPGARVTGDESYFDDVVDQVTARPKSFPVLEYALSDREWPRTWRDRASYALELELSMRGVGFTWTTADVRHTRKTWLPSVQSRVHSILVHCVPVMLISLLWLRHVYTSKLHHENMPDSPANFDALPLTLQLSTTAALGAFLMAAFSVAHSAAAIAAHPLHPMPLAYFPPLYTTRVWNVTSVRGFWSYGWHRLFARLFLVWGVWPGEWLERALTGKTNEQPADVGKVLGAFASSAFVHAFAVRTVVGGGWHWRLASGEAVFFAENGIAVILEELIWRAVVAARGKGLKMKYSGRTELGTGRWYDGVIGRIWWACVLLFTGRNFARGWVGAGLVREMSGL